MRKILKMCALLFVVMCAGLFVACGETNDMKSCADNFKFTYVNESATKTTDETNHNIKINLKVENLKESNNTLSASKFVLKQNNTKVNTSASFGSGEGVKTSQAFDASASMDIELNMVALKTLTGECILYYGDVQLFKVNI